MTTFIRETEVLKVVIYLGGDSATIQSEYMATLI